MSGPPRPRCFRHRKNDCQECRGNSRKVFGVEFHEEYFGDGMQRDTSVRPAGRLNDSGEGVPT